ncbi:DUF4388 domain-containing protein [Candidatus Gracilibacteria bacterium]|nr:DUF4388 domain-containing protein [Candidatus Gracilibacteria bacterium]
MKLEGSISTFPLRELIDMVVYSSVTGSLNVYGTSGSGHCFFRDGRLYHSTYDLLSGPIALEALFAAQNTHFTFVSDATVEEETIWGNFQFLLDKAEQDAERWRRIRATIPVESGTPRLKMSLEKAQEAAPQLADLLMLIDGVQTLPLLQQALGWERIDLCEALEQLVERGVVTFDARLLPVRSSTPGRPSSATIDRGIFERIMQRST